VFYDGCIWDEPGHYIDPNYPAGSGTGGAVWPFPSYLPSSAHTHVRGWEGLTLAQKTDSLVKLKQNVWLKKTIDSISLHGLSVFRNTTDYDLLYSSQTGSQVLGDTIWDACKTGVRTKTVCRR
jgi:hypothetical protein